MAEDYRPKSPDLNFDEAEPQQLQQQQQQQQHEENIPSHSLRIEAPAQHQPYNNWYQAQPQPYSPHGRSYSYSASAQSPIGLPTFHRPYQHQDPQSATSPTAGYTSPAFAPPTFYSHSHSQSHSFEQTQPFSPIGYPQHEQQQQQQQPGYPTAYQSYFSQQQSQPKLPPHGYGAQPPRFDEGPTIYVKHEPEPDTASTAAKMPPRRAPAPEPPAVDPSPVKTKFPTARIKRIMQNDEEVGKVAQQTPIAVGKALEMFMIQLVTKSAEVARDKNSKRVTPAMLKTVIEADDQWDFLRDIASKVEPDREGGGGGAGSKGKAAVKPETDSDEELEEEEEEEVKPVRRRGGRKKKAPA